MRTTPVSTALAFAVCSLMTDSHCKAGKHLLHIAAAALAAIMFYFLP